MNRASASGNDPFFSVVIPTLNEAAYLPHLLTDLAQQSYQDFELLVVDGSSDDKTADKAKKLGTKLGLPLTTYQVAERNVSFQRNFGAKKARGQWVIFMDADNRLPNYFLDGIKYNLAKNTNISVFTTWLAVKEKKVDLSVFTVAANLVLEFYQSINKPVAWGALIGAQKRVLANVQFDQTQQVYEDGVFIQTAVKKGYVFKVFKEPQFMYSLRRLKKEGTLKMAIQVLRIQLRYLQGKDFSKSNYGYTMEGGSSYSATSLPFSSKINDLIRSASQKQLQQAKKILQYLIEPFSQI